MKKVLFIFLVLYASAGTAQTLTKKYNDLNNRYEYFDSYGNMVGYQYYDSLDRSWKYYKVPQQQQSSYVQPINTNLVNRALASKQGRYDTNVAKIDEAIQDIANKITELDVDDDTKQRISNRFSNIIERLNSSKANYSSTTATHNVISWLYTEINKAIKEETN